jgi:hypothetical protein
MLELTPKAVSDAAARARRADSPASAAGAFMLGLLAHDPLFAAGAAAGAEANKMAQEGGDAAAAAAAVVEKRYGGAFGAGAFCMTSEEVVMTAMRACAAEDDATAACAARVDVTDGCGDDGDDDDFEYDGSGMLGGWRSTCSCRRWFYTSAAADKTAGADTGDAPAVVVVASEEFVQSKAGEKLLQELRKASVLGGGGARAFVCSAEFVLSGALRQRGQPKQFELPH